MVSFDSKGDLVDLLEPNMATYGVIRGMHWLYICFPSLDCQTHKIVFRLLGLSVMGLKGDSLTIKRIVISYLRARRLISKKRCLHYYLTWVKDSKLEGPSFHLALLVNVFSEVLSDNPHGVLRMGILSCRLVLF